MIKKLSFIFVMSAFMGCSNIQPQLKDSNNTIFALDKSNTGRICALYPDKQKIKTFGTLVHGKLEGKYIEYYENGSPLLKTNYAKGKQNGIVKKFYPDGQLQIKGYMREDMPNGKFTFFDEEGNRESVKNFKDGVYDGNYMEFYSNGAVKTKGVYTEGYKNGLFSFYNDKGRKIQEGYYVNGLRNGIWKDFDENGKVVSSVDYKNIGHVNPEDKINNTAI